MDTREKILEAARGEFARHGLDGARVDRIARQARVNKAMIYYHFRSKEMLYQAVIDDHLSQLASFLEQNIDSSDSPDDLFLKISAFINTLFVDRQNFVPIMLREIAGGGGRMQQALSRLISGRGIASKMKTMIDRGIKEGRFRKVDSKQTMISFIGMNIFYLITTPMINTVWEIKDEKKFRKNRPQEVAKLLLYGLKIR